MVSLESRTREQTTPSSSPTAGQASPLPMISMRWTPPCENDRTRFTISPEARPEILKRLLNLNHQIHEREVKAGLWEKKKAKKSKTDTSNQTPLLMG